MTDDPMPVKVRGIVITWLSFYLVRQAATGVFRISSGYYKLQSMAVFFL
jgi:hypothetical protein